MRPATVHHAGLTTTITADMATRDTSKRTIPRPGICSMCGEHSGHISPRSKECDDCRTAKGLYRTTQSNLKNGFNRKNKGSPSLNITLQDFCRWRRKTPQVCHYCGIPESNLRAVGMKSQIQRDVKTMGVDRVDSSRGYEAGNLVPCCFVCNQVKGDRFTAAEMRHIGAGIGRVWTERLR